MLIELDGQTPWERTVAGPANVTFASASSPDAACVLTIRVNGEAFDKVYLRVPHSWWAMTAQLFCPPLDKGDVLRLEASAPAAVRLDLTEAG